MTKTIELLMDEVAYSQLQKLQNSEDYKNNKTIAECRRKQRTEDNGLHNQLKKLEKQWKAKKIKRRIIVLKKQP